MNTKVVPNPEQKGWEEDGTTPNGTPIYKWESGGGSGGSSLWKQNGNDIYYNDGNVGVGVPDPDHTLAVKFDQTDTVGDGNIGFRVDNTYWSNRLSANPLADLVWDRFYGGNHHEAMRVQRSTGNVGIGTNSPARPLTVKSDSYPGIQLIDGSTDGDTASDGLLLQKGGNDGLLINRSPGSLIFKVDDTTTALTINATGDATFSGSVTAGGTKTKGELTPLILTNKSQSSQNKTAIDFVVDQATASIKATRDGAGTGGDLEFYTMKAGVSQRTLNLNKDGDAEFSGPVKINGDLLASKPTAGNDAFSAGFSAGLTGQGEKSVAIGRDSGKTDQGSNSTAVGAEAGKMTQGDYGIAVGHAAGNAMQGISAVAVGVLAGSSTQGDYSVAIGRDTGSSKQGANSTAVGRAAGKTSQSDLATAIGYGAGRTGQGKSAVAIGDRAGNENQAANGIIINSSGATVDSTTVGHIIIKSSTQDLRSLPNGGFAMNRDPIIGTRSLISTLSTLRNATKDETTLEGLRDSIGNAIGGLIEKYEAEIATMPAPELHPDTHLNGKVNKLTGMTPDAADDNDKGLGLIEDCVIEARDLEVAGYDAGEEITVILEKSSDTAVNIEWSANGSSQVYWVGGGSPDLEIGINVIQFFSFDGGTGPRVVGAFSGVAS